MLLFCLATDTPDTVTATYLGLKASDWITIAAIIVGPILAVLTQLIWQLIKQRRDAKVWVFSTMMSLRGFPLNQEFIRAANSIDVVFFKNEEIRTRWKTVVAYLSSDQYKPENFTVQAFEKFRDLLAELLSDMAKDLGYGYDYTHIKEQAWTPMWHRTADEEWLKVRQGLLAALTDKGSLGVKVYAAQPASAHKVGEIE
jgi:hypothetical protein